MDMEFSAPVHIDAALLLEVIDDEWAADVLPLEDIDVPLGAAAPADDDDIDGVAPPTAGDADAADAEDRWTDLALDSFGVEGG